MFWPFVGYVDPGTGSFLLQLLIAGILGGAFAIKMGWRRICQFFGSFRKHGKEGDSDGAAG